MPDNKYCYPNSDVLKNKLNIMDARELFDTESELTFIRLHELQEHPIHGKYGFAHLKAIHKYIFQDIYDWAGKERMVEIGKGNLFCTTACLNEYAESIFLKYFPQCYNAREDFNTFVEVFAENYGDLNALHPFREGNGRAQREFARVVCLKCGYRFSLSHTTHNQMLEASILSFNKGDNSGLIRIFKEAITPYASNINRSQTTLDILTSDDLTLGQSLEYELYGYEQYQCIDTYTKYYKEKIDQMDKVSRDFKNNTTESQDG